MIRSQKCRSAVSGPLHSCSSSLPETGRDFICPLRAVPLLLCAAVMKTSEHQLLIRRPPPAALLYADIVISPLTNTASLLGTSDDFQCYLVVTFLLI